MKRKLLLLLVMLASVVSMRGQNEKTAYALLSEDGTTLTFYYDHPYGSYFSLEESYDYNYLPQWVYNGELIKKVVFDSSFAEARPVSTAYWFLNMYNLTTIEGIQYLNTEEVRNMGHMFEGCSSLTSLDLSYFDTKNVKDMQWMFVACSSLTSLDPSNFDTQNVTDMSSMFNCCSSLTSLDISNFNTHNVTNMSGMFNECSSLTSLDPSNFDTQNVTDMSWMFSFCPSLTTLNLSNFNTRNVMDMSGIFWGCSSLTSLDISNLDTRNVTRLYGMFYDCSSLTSLDISNFDTRNVTDMANMFCGCSSLTSLDISNFDTRNVTEIYWMFSGCSSLTSLDLSNFDFSNVLSISTLGILSDCRSLSKLIIPASAENFCVDACTGVGTETSPCILIAPTNFNYGVEITGDFFYWNHGFFTFSITSQYKNIAVNTDLGYITYCSNKSLDFTNVEGMKAYTVVGYDGKVAKLSRMSIVPAETGMLLKADAGNYEIPYTDEDNYVTNMLVGVLENSTLDPTEGSMTNFVLANGNNGLGFYRLKGSGILAAHRAYLQVPSSMLDNGAKFISMEFDDETTSISGITTQEEDAPYYDLQGVRHEGKPSKQGIYIMNGKKVVVKD